MEATGKLRLVSEQAVHALELSALRSRRTTPAPTSSGGGRGDDGSDTSSPSMQTVSQTGGPPRRIGPVISVESVLSALSAGSPEALARAVGLPASTSPSPPTSGASTPVRGGGGGGGGTDLKTPPLSPRHPREYRYLVEQYALKEGTPPGASSGRPLVPPPAAAGGTGVVRGGGGADAVERHQQVGASVNKGGRERRPAVSDVYTDVHTDVRMHLSRSGLGVVELPGPCSRQP